MSVHMIYYKDGVKKMRPVHTREEYLALRNGGEQQAVVQAVRQGDENRKSSLVQMNYSCLPNDDGTLKGSKRMSTTVGMDVDWTPSPLPHEGEEQIAARKEEWLKKVPEMVLSKKDALGLLMLERSASKGFHLVFRRRPELSQEDNLRWASDLLGVEYDKGAKDITRVFFTTTEAELIYLDDEIFRPSPLPLPVMEGSNHPQELQHTTPLTHREGTGEGLSYPTHYNGIPYADIIAKYWELFNDGKEPVEGDRNALTFELAVTLRSICGFSLEKMMQVVPNYWAKKCTEGSVPLCTFKAYEQLSAQITRWFRHFSIYIGGENLTGFKQKNPIINAANPFSNSFEPTLVWGPVSGAMGYIGIRFNLEKL